MLDPRTEAMLHAAAFGDLVDRTALDRALAEAPEARARFEHLQQLAGDLRAMGTVDAPADLKPTVMQHVAARALTPEGGQLAAPEMRTEETMSKKLMLGIAATVAAGLGLYVAMGGSIPPRGTEGTIGAAKRYQGQQLTASDVKLGDQALQSFLQSPAFDTLRRSPEARKAFQKAVTSGNLAAMLRGAEFRQLASEPALMARAMDADMRALAMDADVQALARDAQLKHAAIDTEALRMAIADVELRRAISDVELRQLASDATFARLATEVDFKALAYDSALKTAFADVELAALLRDADFAVLFSDVEFARLLNDATFRNVVNDTNFLNMNADTLFSAFDTAARKSGEGQKEF
ncbi:hypothetical protein [Luteitalea sp. TBR-22]|uniref:hypothetical protein n=1 Tax=Luteitalea sp. TBR-22 TaxID=2802971 RepID=UPI001EF7470C|nr:hypothetical protein [Luteitalea sp. TBR-22]